MTLKNIRAEDILSMCEVEDVPVYGTVMTYEEFRDDVESGCITDYDGEGEIILLDKVIKDSYISIYNWSAHVEPGVNAPLECLYETFGDDMKICWYNK